MWKIYKPPNQNGLSAVTRSRKRECQRECEPWTLPRGVACDEGQRPASSQEWLKITVPASALHLSTSRVPSTVTRKNHCKTQVSWPASVLATMLNDSQQETSPSRLPGKVWEGDPSCLPVFLSLCFHPIFVPGWVLLSLPG